MQLSETRLADIDLLDRDVFTGRVPHEWFAYLREHAPVYRHPEPDGPGFWVITRYDDIVATNRDWETSSSDQDRGGVVGLEELIEPGEFERGGKLMLTMDPPEHTRYRKLVNKGFTPRMINALEPHIRELAVQIVDGAIAKGSCDFVVDVAAELPLEAIAELIGVPLEDRHKIFEWSNRMIGSEDPEYLVSSEATTAAQVEMFLYAQQLADDRRRDPSRRQSGGVAGGRDAGAMATMGDRQDIVTTLLEAEVDGDRLSELDFNLFFLLLAVAGNETTRNAISHGLDALLTYPDQYELLVDDPSRVAVATEEILRWASPVMYFRRNTTRDHVLGDIEIAAGDKVSLWYISGNRDESVFNEPFAFDVMRTPNPHIAFGGGGPHFCLGASLARLEIRVLFEELVQRAPRIERVGDTERLRSNFINGIKHLPVTLHG